MAYQPQVIEKKWQNYWAQQKTFKADIDYTKQKLYVLDMFPYPSGSGLHVGHVEGYTATDIYSRYKRMQQFNVLHVIGWDSFGLPAENYAIKTGQHPQFTTDKNIETFRRQVKAMGFSYDWDREISTCDPAYFKWTQWIFLKIFEKGLAYQDDALVNWCPALKTVLSNEEVIDGLSEIGAHPVIRKPLRQWMLKITHYAQHLKDGLVNLDWPKSIIEMQKNWIGQSSGISFYFNLANGDEKFSVYTVKPETIFGVTYCALAPEHPLLKKIIHPASQPAVDKFLAEVSRLKDRERTNDAYEKNGVFTGVYALHPISGKKIPIWIADYVLMGYGSGAVMGVPSGDKRDEIFAKKYGLEIIDVIQSADNKSENTDSGHMINSDFLNDLDVKSARKKIITYFEEKGLGKRSTNYKLRDWIFSRQRYWGEPIPLLLGKNEVRPVDYANLPVKLPAVKKYQPTDSGLSPLEAVKEWHNIKVDDKIFRRETNTMPQWAGSCWYYLRFLDPKNDKEPFSKEAEKYWMPVDLYIGGAEHAVLHLLYARFWHKILYDYGYVSGEEPFKKLVNQGTILGEDGVKMSKSRGNVISPDEIIKSYGADTLRVYEMFLGPLEKTKPWQSGSIDGVYRFLNRIWDWLIDSQTDEIKTYFKDVAASHKDELIIINRLIKKVTADLEALKFNTAISAMMIFLNDIAKLTSCTKETAAKFVLILNPFAPHLAEELWHKLGKTEDLSYVQWPSYDETIIEQDLVKMVVQVLGKTRVVMDIEPSLPEEEVLAQAKQQTAVIRHISGKNIRKVIFVPDRIINLIVS